MKGKKGGGGQAIQFDLADCNLVMSLHGNVLDSTRTSSTGAPAEPNNPMGERAFSQHRSALKHLCKKQLAANATNLHWDMIWTFHLENLHALVKV